MLGQLTRNVVERNYEVTPEPDFGPFCLSSAFQPIVSLTHQRIVGYEALARASINGEPVSPGALFDKAEQMKCPAKLDNQLNAQHLQSFADQTPSAAWLFLNINRHTINDADFDPEVLAASVRAQGLAPQQVVLEVVEDPVADESQLAAFIGRARELDFRIAIDDFGAGDSNFERVWRLEPHIVKIDRSMLVHGTHNRRARQLLLSLVNMLRESGSLVLMEGIENYQEAELAFQSNADMFQGFYFARPGALPDSEASINQQLKQFTHQHNQTDWMRDEAHNDYLKLLRFEVLAACHELARTRPMPEACQGLLQLCGVKRCFMVDFHGVQQGEIISSDTLDQNRHFFNPLYHSSGACWSHREYYRDAMENPHQIHITRPYVALPDAERTITLSVVSYMQSGSQVFCIDLHPDDLFDGQLAFPPHL